MSKRSSISSEISSAPNLNELMDADPDFFRGSGQFEFPNGDKYEGEYVAHRKGLVWREGKGIYYTHDGQTYNGVWFSDKLVSDQETEITYQNGHRYLGHIEQDQYVGSAMYTIDEQLHILADFVGNQPVRNITLIDMKGREWTGTAGENKAILLPQHTFFLNIGNRLGKGKQKIQQIKATIEKTRKKAKRALNLKKLEAKIFAKSKKTVADLKFEDSVWYQNYKRFRKVYDEIKEKLITSGEDSLCQEERDWLEKFYQFKEKYLNIMQNRATPKLKNLADYNLFELYNDEEYMQDHLPVPVFYPTDITEEEEEEESTVEEERKLSTGVTFENQ